MKNRFYLLLSTFICLNFSIDVNVVKLESLEKQNIFYKNMTEYENLININQSFFQIKIQVFMITIFL